MERKEKLVKVPILTNAEVARLADVMYSKDATIEKEETFWEDVYVRRGLHSKQKLIYEFDRLVLSDKLHLRLSNNKSPLDMSDDNKIKLMKIIKSIDKEEDAQNG